MSSTPDRLSLYYLSDCIDTLVIENEFILMKFYGIVEILNQFSAYVNSIKYYKTDCSFRVEHKCICLAISFATLS